MIDVGDEALDLLDIKEVAARLRVSKSTVRRLIGSGKLEAVKIGVLVRVDPAAVLAYKESLRAAAREQHDDRPAA